MASLSKDQNTGCREIQFKLGSKRPVIYLGDIPERTARLIKSHVEHLIAAKVSNTAPPLDTLNWLNGIDDKLHAKIAGKDLIASRLPAKSLPTAAEYFDTYLKARSNLKERSLLNFEQARNAVDAYFKTTPINKITVAAAKLYRESLEAQEYAEASIGTFIKKARQVFGHAVDDKLIESNPFKGVKVGSFKNANRMQFIDRATMLYVLQSEMPLMWRLMFAAARFQGMRTPSETSALRWRDIDFVAGKITIHSKKTAHHPGKDKRVMPLFPEFKALLLEVPAENRMPAIQIMPKSSGLHTKAIKHLNAIGITPWMKLFQNLRSSCETELTLDNPLHVVCDWIGNTEAVAKKHYLQVIEQHFENAAKGAASSTVDNAGKHRKTDVADGETDSVLSGNQLKDSLPVGGTHLAEVLENLQFSRAALRRALHSQQKSLGSAAVQGIAHIERELAAAQLRVGRVRTLRKRGGR